MDQELKRRVLQFQTQILYSTKKKSFFRAVIFFDPEIMLIKNKLV